MRISLLLAMAIGASFIGSNCGGSGVGDPCTPEDEYLTSFTGFSQNEVNIESRSFQCLTRVCLVNHFQGRVSCPLGQVEDPTAKNSGLATCMGTTANRTDPACLPGGALHEQSCQVPDRDGARWEDRIAVPVQPQLVERQADQTVYCSCRCGGEGVDPATLCDCPSNYACVPLVDDLGLGKGQLAGDYCVQKGTEWDPGDPQAVRCTGAACDKDFTYVRDGAPVGRNQDRTACLPTGADCSKNDGDTCCDAPEKVRCVAVETATEERNCTGECVSEFECKHGEDASTIETIWRVPTSPCPGNNTKCG
jgi:hypothetical protein